MAGTILREANFSHTCTPPGSKTVKIDGKQYPQSIENGIGTVWMCPCSELFEVRSATYRADTYQIWYEPSWKTKRKYKAQVAKAKRNWETSSMAVREKMISDENIYRAGDAEYAQRVDAETFQDVLRQMQQHPVEDNSDSILNLNNPVEKLKFLKNLSRDKGTVKVTGSPQHPDMMVVKGSAADLTLKQSAWFTPQAVGGDLVIYKCNCGKK